MIFSERSDGGFNCIDWCDIAADDVLLGLIETWDQDGHWRFTPLSDRPLTCIHARRISDKLGELDKELISVLAMNGLEDG